MIALFTDFGRDGPYVGQLHAVLARDAPGVPVIDLLHDAPACQVRAAAYLLPACVSGFPVGSVFVCVVDPGVGSARRAFMVQADHRWFVGPDNGLFQVLARQAAVVRSYELLWRPARLSASFHGRDLFAPVAAQLARGQWPDCQPAELTVPAGDWPADLPEVIYIDRFGNAMTGLRASAVPTRARLRIGADSLEFARTFSEVPPGAGFWYANANGLVELAVNQASAVARYGIAVGQPVDVLLD